MIPNKVASAINKMNSSDEIYFKDIAWQNYHMLSVSKDDLVKQVHNLYYTGLREPNDGIEYTFLPTKIMWLLECELQRLYNRINVVDHETALCNEVFYTSKIEGAKTTIQRTQEIHDGEILQFNNLFSESMIKNGFEATKYMNIVSNRVDNTTIRKCWEILTNNCKNNTDIEGTQYRTGNVQVGSHVGLNHALLDDMMDRWIEFYNSDSLKEYPFIKASILHFTFEHIHPFCDGNGRMGRLLMNNFLIKEGYEKIKAISFSKEIERDLTAYSFAFSFSENVYSDCTPFILYMLQVMMNSFNKCIQ